MMNRHNFRVAPTWLALSLLIVALPMSAGAESENTVRYVTVSFGSHSLGGDFTGNEIVSSVKGFFAIPSVGDGEGFGLALGARVGLVGIEAGYRQANHTVRWREVRSEADWRGLGVEGRFYTPEFGPARGFVGAGVAMEWFSVENGYCSDSTGLQCGSRFEGLGFSAGPGVVLRVHDRVFVTGRAVYHWSEFDTVESLEHGASTLPFAVSGDGWAWSSGIGVTF